MFRDRICWERTTSLNYVLEDCLPQNTLSSRVVQAENKHQIWINRCGIIYFCTGCMCPVCLRARLLTHAGRSVHTRVFLHVETWSWCQSSRLLSTSHTEERSFAEPWPPVLVSLASQLPSGFPCLCLHCRRDRLATMPSLLLNRFGECGLHFSWSWDQWFTCGTISPVPDIIFKINITTM